MRREFPTRFLHPQHKFRHFHFHQFLHQLRRKNNQREDCQGLRTWARWLDRKEPARGRAARFGLPPPTIICGTGAPRMCTTETKDSMCCGPCRGTLCSADAAGRHPPTSSSSNSWKDAGTLLALVVFRHRGASCVPSHSTRVARTLHCWCRHHERRRRSRRRQALSVPPPGPMPAAITLQGHPLRFAPLASGWRATQCGVNAVFVNA